MSLVSPLCAHRRGQTYPDARLTGGTVHQAALGCFDAEGLEAFGLLHGHDDGLYELLDLLVEAANVVVRLCRLLVDLHRLDARVVLGGEGIEDEVRVLVDADEVFWSEGGRVDESDEREEDGLPRRGLDDGALALALRVEVDVGALAGLVLVRVNVQDLCDSRVSVRFREPEPEPREEKDGNGPRRRCRQGRAASCCS